MCVGKLIANTAQQNQKLDLDDNEGIINVARVPLNGCCGVWKRDS